MVLVKKNLIGSYSTHYEYVKSEESWKKFKELFSEEDIKEIVNSKGDEDDKILALCEHLNSLGWSDEEIIWKFLDRKNGKYFTIYRDENNGYFDIYEVQR